MELKCFRFECSQCGDLASIQVFYRKDGTIGCTRARHKNEKGFYYHPLTKEYVIEKLREMTNLGQGQSAKAVTTDHNNRIKL